MAGRKRHFGNTVLGTITWVYIAVLYVPFAIMFILSFTGPGGGPTFPMQGVSTYWYQQLFGLVESGGISASSSFSADIGAQLQSAGQPLLRSLALAVAAAAISTTLGLLTAMAFRRPFRGSGFVFYFVLLGVITPGLVVGLGIALFAQTLNFSLAWWLTGLGVHVIWTYPFCFIVFMMMFNRFDRSLEEAAMVLGANQWVTFRRVTLPLIMPGVATSILFGFTLSMDEYIRSFFTMGSVQTLPLMILSSLTTRVTPTIYALGTMTTVVSLTLIAVFIVYLVSRKRKDIVTQPIREEVPQ